jgi:hypothetical protein
VNWVLFTLILDGENPAIKIIAQPQLPDQVCALQRIIAGIHNGWQDRRPQYFALEESPLVVVLLIIAIAPGKKTGYRFTDHSLVKLVVEKKLVMVLPIIIRLVGIRKIIIRSGRWN